MTRSINANLTPTQVHEICHCLNREAASFDALVIGATKTTPKQTVGIWNRHARRLRELSGELSNAIQDDDHNSHVPHTFAALRLPADAL